MRDLFIVLPGIMGSVLTKDGDDLWDPGWGLATKLFKHRQWVQSLTLGDDDPETVEPADGVIPTALVRTQAIVPGLVSIDGYTELDQSLRTAFGAQLIEGSPLQPEIRLDRKDPTAAGFPNYYQFAYDWRRDNRANALRLHDLIDVALSNVQRTRNPKAKVVFVAHSMGGLIARYYMYGTNPRTGEPFEGWRNTRELFSMGTPYRGSLDSLQHLNEGFRKLFLDLSAALRSYTSVYQLLPRYPVVLKPGSAPVGQRTVDDYLRPHELVGVDGLDVARARSAYEDFHLSVDAYITGLGEYHRLGIVPDVGFGHPTLNSARQTGAGLELSRDVPEYLDRSFGGGDGTVPLLSSIPPELDDQRGFLRYTNQQHGSLQSDERTLSAEIFNRLVQSQAGTTKALNPVDVSDVLAQPALSIECPQYVMAGEAASAVVDVKRADGPSVAVDSTPTVDVVDLATDVKVIDGLHIELGDALELPREPGDYRIEVTCGDLASKSLLAVIDA